MLILQVNSKSLDQSSDHFIESIESNDLSSIREQSVKVETHNLTAVLEA